MFFCLISVVCCIRVFPSLSTMNGEEILGSHVEYWLSPDTNHDCYFIVGLESYPKERIGSFKAFLSGHSEPFRLMLQDSELKEQGDVNIVDIQPDTFKHFLKCLYMNCENISKDKISLQDCIHLLYVADKYLVTHVKEKLLECLLAFLKHSIGIDDVFTALSSPVFLKEKCFENRFKEIIQSNLTEIFSSLPFLHIPSESLLWILKLRTLDVDELTLWQVLVRWAMHNTGSKDGKVLRQQMLKHLKYIRFFTLDLDVFCQKVVPTDILSEAEVYEICKSRGLQVAPNMKFVCNNIIPRLRKENSPTNTFSYCVNNLSSRIQEFETTPLFTFEGLNWLVEIDTSDGYLSLHLCCKSDDIDCYFNVEFHLFNYSRISFSQSLSDVHFDSDTKKCGYNEFILMDNVMNPLNKYILDDSILIKVQLTALD